MYVLIAQTVLLFVCGYLCFVAASHNQHAHNWFLKSEALSLKLRSERDRVTVLERELDSLRRELRKLSGKFYASLREREEEQLFEETPEPTEPPLVPEPFPSHSCENWIAAQTLGPMSQQARCECEYCTFRRNQRRALREALVPRTVQAQAELAKLNAGKP